METHDYTPPLSQDEIAEISAEAKINLGSMISKNAVLKINEALAATKTSPDKLCAAVRAQLQELYPDFNFSLTN